ncbi:hypothetical protein RCL1_001026 [Eukaryota sp. TZLM3-RCL]
MSTSLVVGIFALTVTVVALLVSFYPTLHFTCREKKFNISTFWIGSVLGPSLVLLFRIDTFQGLIKGLTSHPRTNPLETLLLFFSLAFLSIYLSQTRIFEYLSSQTFKKSGTNPKRFFIATYILVSVVTLVTSNDIVILVITPFIYHISAQSGLNPVPFLIVQFFTANIWSALFYIGNPTNLYVAAYFKLNFIEYAITMAPTVIFAGIFNGLLTYHVTKPLMVAPVLPVSSSNVTTNLVVSVNVLSNVKVDEDWKVDVVGVVIGGVHLVFAIILLALSPLLKVEMYKVTLIAAGSLLLCLFVRFVFTSFKFSAIYKSITGLPFALAPFLVSMFIMTRVMEDNKVTEEITKVLEGLLKNIGGKYTESLNVFIYGLLSSFSANLMNNIPMTVFFSSVINSQVVTSRASMYALAFGSNIGANISPLGALAGIMWLSILSTHSFKLKFSDFVKYGIKVTLPVLFSSLVVMSVQFYFF